MAKHFVFTISLWLVFFSGSQPLFAQPVTFSYTGSVQTYVVPTGIMSLRIDARGAQGGGEACYSAFQSVGGCGGRVLATVAVTPGQVLLIIVGEKPGTGAAPIGPGGYGGGGIDSGWSSSWPGAGGGGATRIIDFVSGSVLMVAGGGGGGGGDACASGAGDLGGGGGGLTGGTGISTGCSAAGGGTGGTQTAGGAAGICSSDWGYPGSLSIGGNVNSLELGSGGGGGGWYGGGSGADGGGGGGGSSYTNPAYATSVTHYRGYNCGNGEVFIDTPCISAGTIIGAASLCTGSAITFSETATGGTWSSSNTAVAIVNTSGLVTTLSAGSTTIAYTLGACASYQNLEVDSIVMPASITGDSLLCGGDSTMLHDATAGGAWSSSNSIIAAINSLTGIVTAADSGPANITYTFTNACGTTITISTITINHMAFAGSISGIDTIHTGATTILTNPATGGAWGSTDTTISQVSSTGMVYGVTPGVDSIFYVDSNSCGKVTAWFHFVVIPIPTGLSSIGQEIPASLWVAPNPVKDYLELNLISELNESVEYTITNLLGERVMSFSGQTNRKSIQKVNLTGGVYMIRAVSEHIDRQYKILVQ